MPEYIETERGICIPLAELDFQAIRAQGPGGQHVNKVATAVQLRFDIASSTAFDEEQRDRLLAEPDRRLRSDGTLVIKAQNYRSQARNRDDAVRRLVEFIDERLTPETERKPTRPSRAVVRKRLDDKTRRGRVKALRGKVDD